MRPNPPRTITVFVAVALLVIGLALYFYPGASIDLVRGLPLPNDILRQAVALLQNQIVTWVLLALSPVLLMVGSILRGI